MNKTHLAQVRRAEIATVRIRGIIVRSDSKTSLLINKSRVCDDLWKKAKYPMMLQDCLNVKLVGIAEYLQITSNIPRLFITNNFPTKEGKRKLYYIDNMTWTMKKMGNTQEHGQIWWQQQSLDEAEPVSNTALYLQPFCHSSVALPTFCSKIIFKTNGNLLQCM